MNERNSQLDEIEVISMSSIGGMASLLRVGFICLLFALPSAAQETNDKPPDLDSVAKAGQDSLKRLERQAASWTATTPLPDGTRVIVEVLITPTMRRSVLFTETQGQRSEAFRIIDRDGYWYAAEGRKAGRYRPYEAPFDLPTACSFWPGPTCTSSPSLGRWNSAYSRGRNPA